MGTGSFPGVKSGRGVTLTPHPLLALWSWKSRAIPLLPLWAVRPVQSLSACTRVSFIFTFTYRHLVFLKYVVICSLQFALSLVIYLIIIKLSLLNKDWCLLVCDAILLSDSNTHYLTACFLFLDYLVSNLKALRTLVKVANSPRLQHRISEDLNL